MKYNPGTEKSPLPFSPFKAAPFPAPSAGCPASAPAASKTWRPTANGKTSPSTLQW